jgi:hypothetical protein
MLRHMPRRFPPPWKAEKIAGGYVVRDANGQSLAYVYLRATETDAMQAKVLTEDEARRVAINIARLPELVKPKDEDWSEARRDCCWLYVPERVLLF